MADEMMTPAESLVSLPVVAVEAPAVSDAQDSVALADAPASEATASETPVAEPVVDVSTMTNPAPDGAALADAQHEHAADHDAAVSAQAAYARLSEERDILQQRLEAEMAKSADLASQLDNLLREKAAQ